MIEIKMPRLSDTMEEGAIASWHKHPGDRIEIGDVLVEIETDKATMDYEAYEAGTLSEILVSEGATVSIGTPIAVLDNGKDSGPVISTAANIPAAPTATVLASRSPVGASRGHRGRAGSTRPDEPSPRAPPQRQRRRLRFTPGARTRPGS